MQLPSNFQDWIRDKVGRKAPQDVVSFCRKSLAHASLMSIFDDRFVHAWDEGLVIVCGDGVTRRCYPRIITYGADFPEKYVT